MRIWLYILAGVSSALIGWNLGQFILYDLSQLFTGLQALQKFSEIVLFPAIAISLAIGIVLNEIFLSNPARPKLNFRTAKLPVLIAAGLGLLSGLIAGGLAQVLFLPEIRTPAQIVRVLGWLCIGSSVGLAEGFTWRWRSIEAGDRKRFRQRLISSVVFGSLASLTAAFLFEAIRQQFGKLPTDLASLEDPVGFSILGAFLGLAFSITSSPSYMAALRAGAGFEYTLSKNSTQSRPLIQKPMLKFVSDSDADEIEEGLSVQLPATGKINIGSDSGSHVYLPGIPLYAAHLEIKIREAALVADPLYMSSIEVNGKPLTTQRMPLKHNYLVTFYTEDPHQANGKELFQFVYYNRFLDPQA